MGPAFAKKVARVWVAPRTSSSRSCWAHLSATFAIAFGVIGADLVDDFEAEVVVDLDFDFRTGAGVGSSGALGDGSGAAPAASWWAKASVSNSSAISEKVRFESVASSLILSINSTPSRSRERITSCVLYSIRPYSQLQNEFWFAQVLSARAGDASCAARRLRPASRGANNCTPPSAQPGAPGGDDGVCAVQRSRGLFRLGRAGRLFAFVPDGGHIHVVSAGAQLLVAIIALVAQLADLAAQVRADLFAALGRKEHAQGGAERDARAKDPQSRQHHIHGAAFMLKAHAVQKRVDRVFVGAAHGVIESTERLLPVHTFSFRAQE